MKKVVLTLFLLTLAEAQANNIQVSQASLQSFNPLNDTVLVQFGLSWEHYFRLGVATRHFDAAWVFVKFRANGGPWRHATLATSGHAQLITVPAGTAAEFVSPPDGKGVFIQPADVGSGDFSALIRLVWRYDLDGVIESDILDVQVHAIEMVYVPEGAFTVGDGGGDRRLHPTGDINGTFRISSEAAFDLGPNGVLDATVQPLPDRTLAAEFPKGFAAFYCMKYEISQGQFTAFLNTLNPAQQAPYTGVYSGRVTVTFAGNTASTTTPDRAMGFLNVAALNAYMDWAALRRMTELEYEKACRGPMGPVIGEFAWGTASLTGTDYVLSNDGQPNALIDNIDAGSGNALMADTDVLNPGPYRCGIFAASAPNGTRAQSGASFYGIMEMTGNVEENTVSVNDPFFRGGHGDGEVDASGEHDVADWSVFKATRGGSFSDTSGVLPVSRRISTTFGQGLVREGGRGARTAP